MNFIDMAQAVARLTSLVSNFFYTDVSSRKQAFPSQHPNLYTIQSEGKIFSHIGLHAVLKTDCARKQEKYLFLYG
jgi:hypothetical protein